MHVAHLISALIALGSLQQAAAGPHVRTCLASAYDAWPSTPLHLVYSTKELQAAIDACAAIGGTVVLDGARPPGAEGGDRGGDSAPVVYLSGSLRLSGSVHLVIPRHVTLLAGSQRSDYGPAQPDWYLLDYRGCRGCSLGGGGAIDGQGARAFVQLQPRAAVHAAGRKALVNWEDSSCPKPGECRPRLVGVVDSARVSISNVRLRDPAYWSLHVLRSEHVDISHVDISSDWWIANTDGEGGRWALGARAECLTAPPDP